MDPKRIGNFTSSEIASLMTKGQAAGSFGKPFYTYIQQTNYERRLGRSLDREVSARPLDWGNLLERRVHDLLGLDYKLCSQETLDHPRIEYWKGSPDFQKFDAGGTIIDSKCPLTLSSFCQLVTGLYDGVDPVAYFRANHKEGEKYYYQLVSNAEIAKCKYAELIVYIPYKSELDAIRALAEELDDPGASRYHWIYSSRDEELPWLPDNSTYKNLNVIRWEVPDSEKWALIERVKAAGAKLITV
jgi:hypothetical protein